MAQPDEIPSSQQSVIKLHTFPEFKCYHIESCSYCIVVEISAPLAPEGAARAPVDLVAVIDRSGSMQGEKLRLVKRVLHFIVSHLGYTDRFGIVVYDDSVQEIAALTFVNEENCVDLGSKIDQIVTGGQTNLSGGLLMGMSLMKDRIGDQADVASVLLFTDGMANSGLTSTADIVTAMRNAYGGFKKFTVNTFGFGSDQNVEMLKEISLTGNGLYYFIEDTEQIPEVFTNCLGGILSTIAQNISICIGTCNGAVVKEINSKNEPILTNGNKRGDVTILDIQLQEEHHVLIELTLPGIEKSYSVTNYYTYAEITVNGLNVISKNTESLQIPVVIPRSADPGEQTPSLVVDEQRNRINAIHSLTEAAEMAGQGRIDEARRVIESTQESIETSVSCDSVKNKSLIGDLSTAMKSLSDENRFVKLGRSTVATLVDSHSAQRSTSMHSRSYTTPTRRWMQSNYVSSAEKVCSPSMKPLKQEVTLIPNPTANTEATDTPPPGFPMPRKRPLIVANPAEKHNPDYICSDSPELIRKSIDNVVIEPVKILKSPKLARIYSLRRTSAVIIDFATRIFSLALTTLILFLFVFLILFSD